MMEFSDILARFGEKWCYYIPSVLLNMTLTGTVAILCVLILRLLMKKAPKSLTFLLWAVVLFRLLCPVSFALPVSLYSIFGTDIREEAVIEYIPTDIVYNPYPQVNLPLPEAINDSINEELPYGAEQLGADPLEFAAAAFTAIWLLGALVMAAWNLAGYGMLLFRLRKSERMEKGIYETDCLDTAIVTGLFFHRIYVPAGLDSELRGCVIEHERQHIRRRDPWFKFLFFAALCIHWYNPLVWIAFHIAVRDMEMACDERVLRKMGEAFRQSYASALLCVAAGERIGAIAPLAFGESDTKKRIVNVLSYGKKAKWAVPAALVMVLAVTVVLAANPAEKADIYEASYKVSGTLDAQETTDNAPYRVTVTKNELIVADQDGQVLHKGQLVESTGLVNSVHAALEDNLKFVEDTYVAWQNDKKCYLIQTKNGEHWLAMAGYPKNKLYDWEIFCLEPNREEPDETYFLAMIETYGGPRAELISTWQTEKFLTGETWYIVGYRLQDTVGLNNSSTRKQQMGYATFRMKDGQYQMTANRRYFVEEIMTGVMLCDDPASLSVDYNLAKESYHVLFILDDNVKQLDQKLNGEDYNRVWFTSVPTMVVLPYEKEGITYSAVYADGTKTFYSNAAAAKSQIRESLNFKLTALLNKRETREVFLEDQYRTMEEIQEKLQGCLEIIAEYENGNEMTQEKILRAYEKKQQEKAELEQDYRRLREAAEYTQYEISEFNRQIADLTQQIEENAQK